MRMVVGANFDVPLETLGKGDLKSKLRELLYDPKASRTNTNIMMIAILMLRVRRQRCTLIVSHYRKINDKGSYLNGGN